MKHPDPVAFRQALAQFTTGVTVITAEARDGEVCGMTANSFTSVSLAPPTILVSVMRGRTLRAITESGQFVVNVLAAGSENVSGHFAGKRIVGWEPDYVHRDGFIGLGDALASFSCVVSQTVEVNDHTLLIAQVAECDIRADDPLVFFGSRYRRLSA